MFRQSKETWDRLRASPAGHRFETLYDHHTAQRRSGFAVGDLLNIVFAWVLIVFGLVVWLVPGPGGFVAFIGLGLLAQRSLWLARRLDGMERYLWRQWQLRFARRRSTTAPSRNLPGPTDVGSRSCAATSEQT